MNHKYLPTTFSSKVGIHCLNLHHVLDFIDYLSRKKNRESQIIGVLLQGILGLQLQEATRLTWDKINLEDKTIVIDGEVKNNHRIRKLPIPYFLAKLLLKYRGTNEARGKVITRYDNFQSYSHAIKRELKKWDPNIGIKPKDFRNTIQTEANNGRWYNYLVQKFVGHAPQGMGEKHYIGYDLEQLVEEFRKEIITKLDVLIANWNCPNDSPLKDFL